MKLSTHKLVALSLACILMSFSLLTRADPEEAPLQFVLIKPTGKFPIGTTNIEVIRNISNTSRTIPVQVWYPASPTGVEKFAPYNTQEALAFMKQITIDHHKIPEYRLVNMMSASNNSYLNAPVSKKQSKYPIIIFSPGYMTPPQSYSAIIEDLSSHGFIVLSVSHAKFPPVETETKMEEGEFHQIWEDNVKALISQLPELKKSVSALERADLDKIGLAGHSFGGSTSLQVCEEDRQCKCAVDIDGFLHAKKRPSQLHKPTLALMANDRNRETAPEKDKKLDTELIALFTKSKKSGPSEYVAIEKMNHFSFTDAWLFLPHAAEREKTISGEEGIATTRKILLWFFDKTLKGKYRNFPKFNSVVITKK